MATALKGYRVLDLTLRAPGQFCSWILADMGAEVICIEKTTPHQRADRSDTDGDNDSAYDVLGRNKRSIGLNLKTPEAQKILHQLCENADVIIESFRPGVVSRLAADYETLSSINSKIIYCSLSGFGQDGCYSSLAGHEINYLALTGALSLIGPENEAPAIPGSLIADFAGGGMQAAMAIILALLVRERTGIGQYLDVAMTDGVLALMATDYADYFATAKLPIPGGEMFTGGAPAYQSYRCKDGLFISVACNDEAFFKRLCSLLGLESFIPERLNKERFAEIKQAFTQRFAEQTQQEWWILFQQYDLCGAPVNTLAQAIDDPHLQQRGSFITKQHPVAGEVKQVAPLLRLSKTPAEFRSFAPKSGEDTIQILHDLGYDAEQITALRSTNVIAY